MRFVPLVLLGCASCVSTEDVRLVAELPLGVSVSEAAGVEMTISRGRCGSEEAVWSTAFRQDESSAPPPLFEGGSYSASALVLDADCAVFAEGCVAAELPLGASELVVPTIPVSPARAGCAPWLCADGLCNRGACALSADADTVALFDMEGVASGLLVDSVADLEASFDTAPTEVEGLEGCGVAASGNASAVALLPGTSTLTLTEGAIDLFAWFPADPPTTDGGVGIFYREIDPLGPLSPFGLVWLEDGRVVVATGRSPDGIPDRGVCSTSPVPTERWVHVGINVGPPGVELWIDGVRQAGEGRFEDEGQPGLCQLSGPPNPLPTGDAPWSILGRPDLSNGEVVGYHTFYGRVDQLRFSNRRRDFSTFVGIVP